jgi:hypothetical protein
VVELFSQQFWYPDTTLSVNIPYQVFPNNVNVFAPLFADAAGTVPIPNPGLTDGAGFVTFYAAAGEYWLHLDTETFPVTLPTPAPGPFLPLSGGTVTGQLGLVSGALSVNVGQALSTAVSTGTIRGGQMTGVGTSTVTFAAMVGYVVDYVTDPTNPSVKLVSMAGQAHPLAGAELTRTVNWWMADQFGVITSQATRPTDAERRTKIQLGVTGSVIGPGTLFNVQSLPVILQQPAEQLADLFYGLGPFSTDGNIVAPNGATLTVQKSSGTVFAASFGYQSAPAAPHFVVSPTEVPMTFRYATRLAASQGPLTTLIDVANYDVGGVITPVPGGANTATIHRVYLFGTGIATAQVAIQYGQNFYASLSSALDNVGAGTFIQNPDFLGIGMLIGYIVVIKSATDLSNAAQAVFVRAGKFAAP